jgi:hypothetical protein
MIRPFGEARVWIGDRVFAYFFVGLAVACGGTSPGTPAGAGGSQPAGTAGSPVTSGGSSSGGSSSGGSSSAGTAGASVAGTGGASPDGTGGSTPAGTGGALASTAGGVQGVETTSQAKLQFDGSLAFRRARR